MATTAKIVVLVLLLFGLERFFETASWPLVVAIRELGPISGWRCTQSGAYVYDPRRDRADTTLLAQPPEDMFKVVAPEVTVERVEANLQGGDTLVWSRLGAQNQSRDRRPEDEGGGERRVYVLSPGQLQAVSIDSAESRTTLCYAHLGDWRIVAEHALG